jgi:hypothetical protein
VVDFISLLLDINHSNWLFHVFVINFAFVSDLPFIWAWRSPVAYPVLGAGVKEGVNIPSG